MNAHGTNPPFFTIRRRDAGVAEIVSVTIVEIDAAPEEAGGPEMGVRVHEAGVDPGAAEVHDLRPVPDVLHEILAVADGGDPTVADRDPGAAGQDELRLRQVSPAPSALRPCRPRGP